MRRATFAPFGFTVIAMLGLLATGVSSRAQSVHPPVSPPPTGTTVNPPDVPTPGALATPPNNAPIAPAQPQPTAPGTPLLPGTTTSPAPYTPQPIVTVPPTPVPIIVEPPRPGVVVGSTLTVRVSGVYGTLVAVSANPAIADVTVDQVARTLIISGKALGTTTLSLHDDRQTVTREVPIMVAYNAGAIPESVTLRITGNPATSDYVRDQAAEAARVATLAYARPGAVVRVFSDAMSGVPQIGIDNRATVDVPVQIDGDSYFTVSGTTHVVVDNIALPRIQPSMLLVSDFPETLRSNGILFTAQLARREAKRFLYYHYNPKTEPSRRILLKVHNSSAQPARVQFIEGQGGPNTNEILVGHQSTQRFLVRELQNEGVVVTIPPNTTINLVNHALPPGAVVSGLLQLREVDGDPLDLTLLAQNAETPTDAPFDATQLLEGTVAHARGEYKVPEFYFEYTYDTSGANLEVPIGQLPLPNLRQGQALAGDYGVKQQVTVAIINPGRTPMPVAIYANPRGGKATGSFLIDRTLVQSHALAPFSTYKIWQETIPAGTFRKVVIVTMPEGGSSYPLRLIFAPDDGSIPPGAPGSPIY